MSMNRVPLDRPGRDLQGAPRVEVCLVDPLLCGLVLGHACLAREPDIERSIALVGEDLVEAQAELGWTTVRRLLTVEAAMPRWGRRLEQVEVGVVERDVALRPGYEIRQQVTALVARVLNLGQDVVRDGVVVALAVVRHGHIVPTVAVIVQWDLHGLCRRHQGIEFSDMTLVDDAQAEVVVEADLAVPANRELQRRPAALPHSFGQSDHDHIVLGGGGLADGILVGCWPGARDATLPDLRRAVAVDDNRLGGGRSGDPGGEQWCQHRSYGCHNPHAETLRVAVQSTAHSS